MCKYKDILLEYDELLSKVSKYTYELNALSAGYVSTKTISGKKYSYLQKRVNGVMRSKYIKAGQLPQVRSELLRRKELESKVTSVKERLDNLEAAAKLLDQKLYRRLVILKRCALVDALPADERKKALSFSNAMTALEGIPASAETERNLALWVIGQGSFKDSLMQALAKYNLLEE